MRPERDPLVRRSELAEHDRYLLAVCIDRYIHDLRVACVEDQGTPDGEPGTVGHVMQNDLRALKERVL